MIIDINLALITDRELVPLRQTNLYFGSIVIIIGYRKPYAVILMDNTNVITVNIEIRGV